MNISVIFQELSVNMRKQVKATSCFLINMKKIHSSVMDKEWTFLAENLQRQEKMSTILEDLETRRHFLRIDLCLERGLETKMGFQEMCMKLPSSEKKILLDLFRRLRKNMLLIKAGIRELEEYTRWKRAMIDEVFNQAIPERKGMVYGPSGSVVPPELNPLVVNQTL